MCLFQHQATCMQTFKLVHSVCMCVCVCMLFGWVCQYIPETRISERVKWMTKYNQIFFLSPFFFCSKIKNKDIEATQDTMHTETNSICHHWNTLYNEENLRTNLAHDVLNCALHECHNPNIDIVLVRSAKSVDLLSLLFIITLEPFHV